MRTCVGAIRGAINKKHLSYSDVLRERSTRADCAVIGISYDEDMQIIGGHTPTYAVCEDSICRPHYKIGVAENWRTYRNDEFGFEVKYPPKYNITTDINEDYGFSCFGLNISTNKEDGESQIVITKNCGGRGLGKQKPKNYIIDGVDANGYAFEYSQEVENYKDILIVLFRKDDIFNISGYKIRNAKDEELFDQILSTFRFIE
jgi:hypothetical protein